MSTRGYYREMLNENPALLADIVAFNQNTRSRTDCAHDSSLGPALHAFPDLEARFEVRARCNEAKGTADEHAFVSFAVLSERLALLPPDVIETLATMTAAALFSLPVSRAVVKAEVLSLRTLIGADIYRWTILRGRFYAGSLSSVTESYMPDAALSVRVVSLARALLDELRNTWPDETLLRTAPVFSSLSLPAEAPRVGVPDFEKRVWFLMKKIILQEFDKRWTLIFN